MQCEVFNFRKQRLYFLLSYLVYNQEVSNIAAACKVTIKYIAKKILNITNNCCAVRRF